MRYLIFILVIVVALPASAQSGPPTVIEKWEKFWNTYDLDQMDELFVNSGQLSYFSSEKEGLTRGWNDMVEHHKGFGFVPGGAPKDARLWLEDIETDYAGDAAIVTAIWFFDVFRDGRQQKMRGPVTFVCRKQNDGSYKLLHVHFANYPGEDG